MVDPEGLDISTPAASRSAFSLFFGAAIADQSSRAFMRLSHTALVVSHLPRGAFTSAAIEQYARTNLRSLSDIEELLRMVMRGYAVRHQRLYDHKERMNVGSEGEEVSSTHDECGECGAKSSGRSECRGGTAAAARGGHGDKAPEKLSIDLQNVSWLDSRNALENVAHTVTAAALMFTSRTTPAATPCSTEQAKRDQRCLPNLVAHAFFHVMDSGAPFTKMGSPATELATERASQERSPATCTASIQLNTEVATAEAKDVDEGEMKTRELPKPRRLRSDTTNTPEHCERRRRHHSHNAHFEEGLTSSLPTATKSTEGLVDADDDADEVVSPSSESLQDSLHVREANLQEGDTDYSFHCSREPQLYPSPQMKVPLAHPPQYPSGASQHHSRSSPLRQQSHQSQQPQQAPPICLWHPDDTTGACREVCGWLHLLVWLRQSMIYLMRELSAVQGDVAWGAWYWSWAQDHPRQAAFHQGLSSLSFWKRLYSSKAGGGGFRSLSAFMRYTTGAHMMALKSMFRLIVSCIGTVHTQLEQLNVLIAEMQQECELDAVTSGLRKEEMNSFFADASTVWASRSLAGPQATYMAHTSSYANLCPNAAAASGLRGGGGGGAPIFFEAASAAVTTPQGGDVHSGFVGGTTASQYNLGEHLRVAVMTTIAQVTAVFQSQGLLFTMAQEQAAGRLWQEGVPAAGTGTPRYEMSGFAATFGLDGTLGSGLPTSGSPMSARFGEYQTALKATLEDGVETLLFAVGCARFYTTRLSEIINDKHKPPAGRHWLRVLVAGVTTIPPFLWLYTKTPSELAALGQRVWHTAGVMLATYVVMPIQQVRESIFYVRPGVEERRKAQDRDAEALANIIRDFHEQYYPNSTQEKLDALRDHTLECLRTGVADEQGYGLIEKQYRAAVKHPIRSCFFGDLPRIMLIQMSYQALEVGRVTNGIDEVLEGNDLNFKMMAMMPVVGFAALSGLWMLMRWRASIQPVRRRMKLLWRAVYRVISFDGDTNPFFFDRIVDHDSTAGDAVTSPCVAVGGGRNSTVAGSAAAHTRHMFGGRSYAFSPASRDENAGALAGDDGGDGSRPVRVPETSRVLNSYEQGMVLLLVHVMRSTVMESLKGYCFHRALLEDLDDLESMRSTRRQRLETLQRMQVVHSFFK